MTLILKPSNLSLTWASAGDILDPGDTKYATGWEVEIPPRQWFNYLDNRQDEAIAHINQRGIAAWDATTDYEAASKSYVQGSNGTVYKSVAASGPGTVVQDPTTDSTATYWTVSFQDVDGVRIDVASASTVNLTTAAPNTRHINITGTTTINGFTVAVGQCYFVRFAATLTLTNGASLVTQTGANILTAAGDTCIIRATAANVVEIMVYVDATVQSLVASGYRKFRDGMIIQWGSAAHTAALVGVTFPISFPNAALRFINGNPSTTAFASFTTLNQTGATVSFSAGSGAGGSNWIAVGW